MAAGLAHAQMQPRSPDREAVRTAGDLVGQLRQLDAVGVQAHTSHSAIASIKVAAS
jgi:hypothetical protein